MDRTMRARDRAVNQIKTLKSYSEEITNEITLDAIETRLEQLELRYKDFNTYELELLGVETYKSIVEQVDELYLTTSSTLKAAIRSRSAGQKEEIDLNATFGQFMGQQQSILQGMSQTNSVRLPKINIEPFTGDYKQWPSFHDLYVTSVHDNNNISPVHKLQLLNGLLKGEAATLIRHIKVTDQNYEEAWSKLVARYNKPKSVVCSLIQLFLDQRNCNQVNHRDLRKLCDTADEVIRGLRALGTAAESRDIWLVHLLVSKLDAETKQLWANESVDEAFPTFEKLLKFLNTRCDALESCMTAVTRVTGPKYIKTYHTTQTTKFNCIACKQDHFLYKCPVFKSMNTENRIKLIDSSNCCSNCLRLGHIQKQCYSRARCLICQQHHHSLLHRECLPTSLHAITDDQDNLKTFHTQLAATSTVPYHQSTFKESLPSTVPYHQSTFKESLPSTVPYHQSPTKETLQSTSQQSTVNAHVTSLHNQPTLNTLLPTALIYVQSSSGQLMPVRTLLDSGSQSTFISEACIQRIGLKRQYAHISIYGLASHPAGKTRGKTTLTIQARVTPRYTKTINALIIEKISSTLPATRIPIPADNPIWQLELADPNFNRPDSVDLLIGAEYFMEILSDKN